MARRSLSINTATLTQRRIRRSVTDKFSDDDSTPQLPISPTTPSTARGAIRRRTIDLTKATSTSDPVTPSSDVTPRPSSRMERSGLGRPARRASRSSTATSLSTSDEYSIPESKTSTTDTLPMIQDAASAFKRGSRKSTTNYLSLNGTECTETSKWGDDDPIESRISSTTYTSVASSDSPDSDNDDIVDSRRSSKQCPYYSEPDTSSHSRWSKLPEAAGASSSSDARPRTVSHSFANVVGRYVEASRSQAAEGDLWDEVYKIGKHSDVQGRRRSLIPFLNEKHREAEQEARDDMAEESALRDFTCQHRKTLCTERLADTGAADVDNTMGRVQLKLAALKSSMEIMTGS